MKLRMGAILLYCFFLVASAHGFATENKCREKIRSIVCSVDQFPQNGYAKGPVGCLPDSSKYVKPILSLFDQYPDVLKEVLCSLNVIFIQQNLGNTAYSGFHLDSSGKLHAGAIINKGMLDEDLSLQKWASWKEQLSFGAPTNFVSLVPGLPTIEVRSRAEADRFLVFAFTHELGHLLDAANHINQFEGSCAPTPNDPSAECKLKPGSFGSISWQTNNKPKEISDFPGRAKLCFYRCNGNPVDRNTIPVLYENMYRAGFVSLYSTVSPAEDFAEVFAYYVLLNYFQSSYRVNTEQGRVYDLKTLLDAGILKQKSLAIKALLNRKDLNYP